jgi:hypothetical protein
MGIAVLGCFGVALAKGQAISTATSAEHDGNRITARLSRDDLLFSGVSAGALLVGLSL